METRHEACSAEGQPRNILEGNPNRFAARCPALSRRYHRVIHSCYAFCCIFCRARRSEAQICRAADDRTASAGLMKRQRSSTLWIDPRCLFKTTARIAAAR